MNEEGLATSIPPASLTGRLGKLAVGAIQVWYAIECVRLFQPMTRPSLRPGIWLFVLFALWIFPYAINLGFRRDLRLGRRPLYAVLGLAALFAAWDWISVGTPWGRSVAAWLLIVTIYTHLHVGVSHLLSAISGVRGCEMRVIPYYLARLRGSRASAELYLCPGFWTSIDRWEAGLRSRSGSGR